MVGFLVPVVTEHDIALELEEFTQEFVIEIEAAGFNCLNLHKNPNAWRRNVVYVVLERLTKCSFTSGLWTRYQVKACDSLPQELAAKRLPPSMRPQFTQDKRQREKNILAKGNTGCLALVICAKSPSLDDLVYYTSMIGFKEPELTADSDWYQTFVNAIEEESGRGLVANPPLDHAPMGPSVKLNGDDLLL